ncbi:hypothetical protein, partial [Bacillus phage SPG24]
GNAPYWSRLQSLDVDSRSDEPIKLQRRYQNFRAHGRFSP